MLFSVLAKRGGEDLKVKPDTCEPKTMDDEDKHDCDIFDLGPHQLLSSLFYPSLTLVGIRKQIKIMRQTTKQ